MTAKNQQYNKDMTREILTPKQFNKSMAGRLSWGYILCAIVSLFFGSWMLSYTGDAYKPESLIGAPGLMQEWFPFAITFDSIFFIPLLLAIVCYMAMYFTAAPKAQTVIFHICALNLSPLLAGIYVFISIFTPINGDVENISVSGIHMGIFWLMIAAYVIVLYLLAEKVDAFFSKARYVAAASVIYTAVMTVLAGVLTGLWTPAFIGLLLLTLFVGLNWFHAYQRAEGASRYYAVTESCRIMNLFGTAFDMKGKTAPSFVIR